MYNPPIDKTKALMNAPCKDRTGHYPESVLCDYDCHRCGWNPKEIRRRTQEQFIREVPVVLRDENGFPIKTIMVKKFVFRRV